VPRAPDKAECPKAREESLTIGLTIGFPHVICMVEGKWKYLEEYYCGLLYNDGNPTISVRRATCDIRILFRSRVVEYSLQENPFEND